MSGKLYALSTGPGASDLITVRASRILGSLDILYAPAGRKGGDRPGALYRPAVYRPTDRHPLLPFSHERRRC